MRKYPLTFISFLLIVSLASVARAEVKNVQMKIAGYLCGN
jgi:hypothetical protein